jgi:GNAT superfamily N-acetyltransferase
MLRIRAREAAAEDHAAIARILSEVHPADADGSTLPRVRQEARTFVATSDDQVIGVAVATLVDYGFSSYGSVEELVVAAGHRGAGVGGELLDRCRDWLTDRGVEVVFVSAVDARAARFYESTGFTPCTGPWLNWVPPTRRPGGS